MSLLYLHRSLLHIKSFFKCYSQTEKAAWKARRRRRGRRRHRRKMHHLSVNTGGGGGCQVNVSPPGGLSCSLLSVFCSIMLSGACVFVYKPRQVELLHSLSLVRFFIYYFLFFKPKGIQVISGKSQSALKLPASWSCFFGTHSGFYKGFSALCWHKRRWQLLDF